MLSPDAQAATATTAHQPPPAVSILIPTRNEADNIDPLLERVFAAAAAHNLRLEVLIVDGASTDGTQDRARSWERSGAPVRLIESTIGRGLAGDVIYGASSARADVVVVMDADLSHPPESIGDLAAPVLAGAQDMVIGSRYVPGGGAPGWPLLRKLTSRAAAALAWPLTETRDPLAGFFAVRRDLLTSTDPDAEGFKIGLEILLGQSDALRVAEVPITFTDRERGSSKMGLSQITAYLRRLAALAGATATCKTAARFGAIGLLGFFVDLGVFRSLLALGAGLALAHIASFTVATIGNFILNARWAFRPPQGEAPHGRWSAYVRFMTVALMALSLRGAVLSLGVGALGWPPLAAIIAAIGVAALVNFLGAAFFVFPPRSAGDRADLRWRIGAIGAVAYMLALRALYMGQIDLLPEEAYYWNYAQHLDIGYLDHPPMVAWIIALFTGLFGDTEFAIRSGAFLCWIVAALFVFLLARNLYDKSTALRSLLLLAVLPFFFVVGLVMLPDTPLVACWAGALYFLERALRAEKPGAWIGVGACIGLGMLSKYTIALLGPATLVFILADRASRRWLLRPEPYLGAAVALLLFSPVIYWNAANDWASFAFQSTRRLDASPKFSLPMLVGSMMILLTPVGLIAAAQSLYFRASADDPGRLDRRRRLFATVFTLVPLSVFVFFSLTHSVKLNWTGPIWLAAIPAVAWGLAPRGELGLLRWKALQSARVWRPTIALTIVVYGLGLHYLVIGLPGVGYGDSIPLPVGWREMGSFVAATDDELERQTGRECLLIGMDRYFITSQLAFYDVKDGVNEAAGRHLFGRNSLMYERWFNPAEHAGQPAIMVSFRSKDLAGKAVESSFDRLQPVRRHEIERNGDTVGVFYYRIGYGYRPAQS